MKTIFKENGVLHRHLPHYKVRENQIKLAEHVKKSIADQSMLIAEAGTGIGKTWAYLIPALKSQKKIIVSTYTKVLQDQIFEKDLPFLLRVLNIDATIALLKGKENYLCLERFSDVVPDFWERNLWEKLTNLVGEEGFTGDRAEIPGMKNDFWQKIHMDRDLCQHKECLYFEECYYFRAREKAKKATVLVMNHASFFLLPELSQGAEVIVFDEAHHVPEVAAQLFSAVLDCPRTLFLLGMLQALPHSHNKIWKDPILKITQLLQDLDQNLSRPLEKQQAFGEKKLAWQKCVENEEFLPLCHKLEEALREFVQILDESKLLQILNGSTVEKVDDRLQQQFDNFSSSLSEQHQALKDILLCDENTHVRFAEQQKGKNQQTRLVARPLNIAERFVEAFLKDTKSLIFTSATLSTDGNFNYFCNHLGLDGKKALSFESPFSYQKNTRLYVPALKSLPNEEEHPEEVLRAAWPLILKSPGGVFILCTANKTYHKMHQILKEVLQDFPQFLLLKQGDALPAELLKQFKEHGKAILVATRTFWEGVDVPGEALSIVVIDKLPFANLSDPVVQGAINYLESHQQSGFLDYQLPQAALTLKQGAGRLIRSESDYGILMIGDNRFLKKSYRNFILRSLPPMPLIETEKDALNFLDHPPTPRSTPHFFEKNKAVL